MRTVKWIVNLQADLFVSAKHEMHMYFRDRVIISHEEVYVYVLGM